ncbi:MAG: disulfide bond formation protein B [Woeseia sp.]|nr:disulfide bond formation protein B [Woeseia sp.]MBT8096523.1 disulfide bond formation protein B [Woeseia sp.]NNE62004.1 disulfide bond formation protein B [Woeseia sp.]NNL55010.1 disulfide bond formation protein B [Woeseia sp.]
MNVRLLNGLGFLACAAMMAYALYAEHQLLLEPCPLCVFQRVATIALGIVFLIAAVHNPHSWGRRVYAGLILLSAGAGLGVAARHVWLQNLPADQVPACGPGFDYIIDAFPLSDALSMIFTGSGECATVDWHFLGLTMPTWVAICFAVLLAFGLLVNVSRIGEPKS